MLLLYLILNSEMLFNILSKLFDISDKFKASLLKFLGEKVFCPKLGFFFFSSAISFIFKSGSNLIFGTIDFSSGLSFIFLLLSSGFFEKNNNLSDLSFSL